MGKPCYVLSVTLQPVASLCIKTAKLSANLTNQLSTPPPVAVPHRSLPTDFPQLCILYPTYRKTHIQAQTQPHNQSYEFTSFNIASVRPYLFIHRVNKQWSMCTSKMPDTIHLLILRVPPLFPTFMCFWTMETYGTPNNKLCQTLAAQAVLGFWLCWQ